MQLGALTTARMSLSCSPTTAKGPAAARILGIVAGTSPLGDMSGVQKSSRPTYVTPASVAEVRASPTAWGDSEMARRIPPGLGRKLPFLPHLAMIVFKISLSIRNATAETTDTRRSGSRRGIRRRWSLTSETQISGTGAASRGELMCPARSSTRRSASTRSFR